MEIEAKPEDPGMPQDQVKHLFLNERVILFECCKVNV